MRKNLRRQLKEHRRHGAIDPSALPSQMEERDDQDGPVSEEDLDFEEALSQHTAGSTGPVEVGRTPHNGTDMI